MGELFPDEAPDEVAAPETAGDDAPLAFRMRPRTFQEVLGQEALLGEDGPVARAARLGRLPSVILVGPPGSGKTTLASLLAASLHCRLVRMSAVSAGVADVRRVVEEARRLRGRGGGTVLFLDEIHHFSRTQQDALLPHVESGLITLIGATTENPSFQLTSALLSRVLIWELAPLGEAELLELVRRAMSEPRGLGDRRLAVAPEAAQALALGCGGDARTLLNCLEQAAAGLPPGAEVDRVRAERALAHPHLVHDRAGDLHFQILSALIKSVRGSDPDAGLYWLARLLEGGEDPRVPARRLVILAAEDVGLADPSALSIAVAAYQAAQVVGMPECRLPLAEATLYLSLAPKSNSVYRGYSEAAAEVADSLGLPVPIHLRNAVTRRDRELGFGRGYEYAHDDPEGLVSHHHLPEGLEGRTYYRPSPHGTESSLGERLARIRERRRPAPTPPSAPSHPRPPQPPRRPEPPPAPPQPPAAAGS
jgi:putative ATPase